MPHRLKREIKWFLAIVAGYVLAVLILGTSGTYVALDISLLVLPQLSPLLGFIALAYGRRSESPVLSSLVGSIPIGIVALILVFRDLTSPPRVSEIQLFDWPLMMPSLVGFSLIGLGAQLGAHESKGQMSWTHLPSAKSLSRQLITLGFIMWSSIWIILLIQF